MWTDRVEIRYTAEFKRNLRRLAKKYPNIRADLGALLNSLQSGETPGDQVPHVHHYTVYKVRVPNRDAQRGKSGGYRVIYYLQTAEQVILITLYSKTEQGDIAPELIRQIIEVSDVST
jgi:mRNA-degrading endonuclease RelE of RelBE toxin-antitoxin system